MALEKRIATIEERIATIDARCSVLEAGLIAAAVTLAGEPNRPDRRFIASLERFADSADANGLGLQAGLMRAMIDELLPFLD